MANGINENNKQAEGISSDGWREGIIEGNTIYFGKKDKSGFSKEELSLDEQQFVNFCQRLKDFQVRMQYLFKNDVRNEDEPNPDVLEAEGYMLNRINYVEFWGPADNDPEKHDAKNAVVTFWKSAKGEYFCLITKDKYNSRFCGPFYLEDGNFVFMIKEDESLLQPEEKEFMAFCRRNLRDHDKRQAYYLSDISLLERDYYPPPEMHCSYNYGYRIDTDGHVAVTLKYEETWERNRAETVRILISNSSNAPYFCLLTSRSAGETVYGPFGLENGSFAYLGIPKEISSKLIDMQFVNFCHALPNDFVGEYLFSNSIDNTWFEKSRPALESADILKIEGYVLNKIEYEDEITNEISDAGIARYIRNFWRSGDGDYFYKFSVEGTGPSFAGKNGLYGPFRLENGKIVFAGRK